MKCKVCGTNFELKVDNHYITRDEVVIRTGISSIIGSDNEGKLYDTFDCPVCGCQNVMQERKRIFVTKEDVEISKIEKFIGVAIKKYDLYVRDIMFASIVTDNNEILYNLHLYRESDLQIICEIYGCELYELMAKTAIYIYALIKNEKVRKRDEVSNM